MERNTPTIDIKLLGTFEVTVDDKELVFPYDKPKLLLAYLIAEGRQLYRSHVASLLWPEKSDHHARQNLRQALSTLNRLLGDSFSQLFHSSRQTIGFIGFERCHIDTEELNEMCKPEEQTSSGQALNVHNLYRGPFCQGLKAAGCEDLDEWLEDKRKAYQAMAIDAARCEANYYRENGNDNSAMQTYSLMLSIDRNDEGLMHEFMQYLIEKGRRSQAISLYRDYEHRLEQDLGIKPSSDLTRLHQALVSV